MEEHAPLAALLPEEAALLEHARAAFGHAYAPYSGFRVGAAIEEASGALYAGCNVENAAYPQGNCAEAGAIAAMVAGGGRRIARVLVYTEATRLTAPCGGCRQRLFEFADARTQVILASPLAGVRRFGMDALLPEAFGPGDLRPDGVTG